MHTDDENGEQQNVETVERLLRAQHGALQLPDRHVEIDHLVLVRGVRVTSAQSETHPFRSISCCMYVLNRIRKSRRADAVLQRNAGNRDRRVEPENELQISGHQKWKDGLDRTRLDSRRELYGTIYL